MVPRNLSHPGHERVHSRFGRQKLFGVIGTQNAVRLVEETEAQPFDGAVKRTVQLQPGKLCQKKRRVRVSGMDDALRIKRKDALYRGCFANPGDSYDGKAGSGGFHNIGCHRIERTACYSLIVLLNPADVGTSHRISVEIPLPDCAGYPLLNVNMRVQRLKISKKPLNAMKPVIGIQFALSGAPTWRNGHGVNRFRR